MITVTVTDAAVRAKLGSMSSRVHSSILREVTRLTLRLERHIKQDKLLGQVLNRKTGALGRSIHSAVTDEPARITGRAYSSGDVKYAAIHEYGGRTKAHLIQATRAKALMMSDHYGELAFFKSVSHPGSVMPERSFMRSALRDMQDDIIAGLKRAQAEGTL